MDEIEAQECDYILPLEQEEIEKFLLSVEDFIEKVESDENGDGKRVSFVYMSTNSGLENPRRKPALIAELPARFANAAENALRQNKSHQEKRLKLKDELKSMLC